MGSTCVVGLQWGDEAKGKIVDLLCDQHDVVVRYQGGANAGHTVVHEGVTYKLSLVPTGILRQGIDCVIGNGVVIHPPALLKEIDRLSAQGIDFNNRLHISDRAHVILPYHLAEERLTEESSSAADHLGTTLRGIGPCYRDKVGRVHGVRVTDLFHPAAFRERLDRIVAYKNRLLAAMLTDFQPFDAKTVADEYLEHAEKLRPFVARYDSLAASGRWAMANGSCSRGAGVAAGYRSWQLSVRDQLQQQRGGHRCRVGSAGPVHRPLDRCGEGLYDPRRWRTVPHRTRQ